LEIAGLDAISQAIDDVSVRPEVIFVLVMSGFVPLVSPPIGMARLGASPAGSLQQAILKVVESAYTWDISRVEAADESIKGLIAHQGHPLIEAGDAAQHHCQAGTQHTDRVAGHAAFVCRVQGDQDRIGGIQVGDTQLAPNIEVTMVGAQTTVATGSVAHETKVLLMAEGLGNHRVSSLWLRPDARDGK
jgi:hypothetical protein